MTCNKQFQNQLLNYFILVFIVPREEDMFSILIKVKNILACNFYLFI